MRDGARWMAPIVVLFAMTCCACTASTVATTRSSSATGRSTSASSSPSSSQPSSQPSSQQSPRRPATRTIADLCAAGRGDQAVAQCIAGSLSRSWSKWLGRRIVARGTLGYTDHHAPSTCALAMRIKYYRRTAFACQENDTMYFGPVFLRNLHRDRPASDFSERLAATMGHEMGHLVQYTVREPIMYLTPTNARSRFIEQQADCLSGVWATWVHLTPSLFLSTARQMLENVDDHEHRLDHGTVAERIAAVSRGISGGTAACRLTARRR